MEDPGLDLVGPTPVGDGMEVFGQRGVAEDLGLLVLGVIGERKGVVGGGAAEEEEGFKGFLSSASDEEDVENALVGFKGFWEMGDVKKKMVVGAEERLLRWWWRERFRVRARSILYFLQVMNL